VTAIARGCPALTKIYLSGCDKITDASVADLKRRLPNCTAYR
jgi:hypothetical protein